ncbi:hypothetical protein N431DRAFT_508291 [Stipitochalara longipes BDJ]|nr:hypothetical protein N431DRAFT_508291 [Stipitochalara longipes BDJ]
MEVKRKKDEGPVSRATARAWIASLSAGTLPKAKPKSKTQTKHMPSKLSSELWERVFQHLAIDDIKSVRISWRVWTDIGSRYLFVPFVFRPDRCDLERFETISKSSAASALLAGIRNFRFELGTMSISWVASNLGWKYFVERNNEQSPYLDEEKNFSVAEYGAWNTRWHDSAQMYHNTAKLRTVFEQVKVVDNIELVYKASSFTTPLLFEAWVEGSERETMTKHSRELTAVLLALNAARRRFKHLGHDQLPVTFFAINSNRLLSLSKPLQQLRILHLTFDATEPPHLKFWEGLGVFLREIPDLCSLRFGFVPFQVYFRKMGTWDWFERSARDWYVPLWRLVSGGFVWRNLKELQLDGLMVCEIGLSEFLSRHASTLRVLTLSNIGLWQGTFKIWGFFRAFHAPNEACKFERSPEFRPEVQHWSPEFSSWMQHRDEYYDQMGYRVGDLSSTDIRHRLEIYVLSRGSEVWPLRATDILEVYPDGFWWDKPEHNSIKCQACVVSRVEVDEAWDRGLEKPLKLRNDYSAKDLAGVGEEDIVDFFRHGGFDRFGFNIMGFDRHGTNYSDITDLECSQEDAEWPAVSARIKKALSRMMLEEILETIPRYAELLAHMREEDGADHSDGVEGSEEPGDGKISDESGGLENSSDSDNFENSDIVE